MPHIILEYSSNLTGNAAAQLLDKLHDALGGTEGFVTDRIKSRSVRRDAYRVGTGDGCGFVHATVVFSQGRPETVRRELVHRLLGIITSEVRSHDANVSTSVEIRQFEPRMYMTERDL